MTQAQPLFAFFSASGCFAAAAASRVARPCERSTACKLEWYGLVPLPSADMRVFFRVLARGQAKTPCAKLPTRMQPEASAGKHSRLRRDPPCAHLLCPPALAALARAWSPQSPPQGRPSPSGTLRLFEGGGGGGATRVCGVATVLTARGPMAGPCLCPAAAACSRVLPPKTTVHMARCCLHHTHAACDWGIASEVRRRARGRRTLERLAVLEKLAGAQDPQVRC